MYNLRNKIRFNEIIEKVKELIKAGDLRESLNLLSETIVNPTFEKELIILVSEYNDLQRKFIAGILDSNTFQISRNNVVYRLLEFLNNYEIKFKVDISKSKFIDTKTNEEYNVKPVAEFDLKKFNNFESFWEVASKSLGYNINDKETREKLEKLFNSNKK